MISNFQLMRPLVLGAVILALASATGCGWFKSRHRATSTNRYTHSVENRPLEVPPDLDLPDTSAATTLPPRSLLGVNRAPSTGVDVALPGPATATYPKIGKALESISGVVINGRAEALGSYDVTYGGQSFLVRVQDSNGGSRLLALSADGRILNTGPAAALLAAIKARL
ncbi:MAG: hypothetical protein ABIW30_07395 [Arenimonas sp.]